jgi:hypothetical protein
LNSEATAAVLGEAKAVPELEKERDQRAFERMVAA